MPYLIDDRVTVWHIPKSGGTWVYRALKAAGVNVELREPQHGTPAEMPELASVGIQAVTIRQRREWYWSVYCHLRDQLNVHPDCPANGSALWDRMGVAASHLDTFDDFFARHQGQYTRALLEFTPPGKFFILRTAYLSLDLIRMLDLAGISGLSRYAIQHFPRQNVTRESGRFWIDPPWAGTEGN